MTGRRGLMIGDFSRRSRLPISTLRYYDRIGLLSPALVDPSTGYRHYEAGQLPDAMLISHLRGLGVAPDAIARIVTGGPSATAALLRERRRTVAQIDAGRERLRRLDELLVDVPADGHEVEVEVLEARAVAALPFLLPASELAPGVTRTIARLRSTLRRAGRHPTGAWGATFPVDLPGDVSGFAFAPVDRGVPGDLDTGRLPAGPAVTTTHRGDPATLPLAYHALFARLDQLGAVPCGPVIEEYLQPDGDRPNQPAVRVRIPIGDPAPR